MRVFLFIALLLICGAGLYQFVVKGSEARTVSRVQLERIDILSREVQQLLNRETAPSWHQIETWRETMERLEEDMAQFATRLGGEVIEVDEISLRRSADAVGVDPSIYEPLLTATSNEQLKLARQRVVASILAAMPEEGVTLQGMRWNQKKKQEDMTRPVPLDRLSIQLQASGSPTPLLRLVDHMLQGSNRLPQVDITDFRLRTMAEDSWNRKSMEQTTPPLLLDLTAEFVLGKP